MTVFKIAVGFDVGDLGERSGLDGSGRGTSPARRQRIRAAQRLKALSRHAMCGDEVNKAAIEPQHAGERPPA